MGVLERIDGICRQGLDERDLRVAVLAELRTAVSFDAYAWLLTDPATCVGSSPVAEVPNLADLPSVIRAKYLTTVNRWTGLSSDLAVTLAPELYGRVAGLTPREADVLAVVATGDDTRHAAHQLAISDHMLQDHLKSILAKTRTNSRRLLIARATGASR